MDRIERHDIINAMVLAIVLLLMAFLLAAFAGRLFDTIGDEENPVISSDQTTVPENSTASSTSSTTEPETTTSSVPLVHSPAEVTVIVANSARISGIAGKGSDLLKGVSYNVIGATNGDTVDLSVVYYAEGYEGDAIQVAKLLQMPETAIAPMPTDLSFDNKGALLAVVIGSDTALG